MKKWYQHVEVLGNDHLTMERVCFFFLIVSKFQKKKIDLKDEIFFTFKKRNNLIFILCEKNPGTGKNIPHPLKLNGRSLKHRHIPTVVVRIGGAFSQKWMDYIHVHRNISMT